MRNTLTMPPYSSAASAALRLWITFSICLANLWSTVVWFTKLFLTIMLVLSLRCVDVILPQYLCLKNAFTHLSLILYRLLNVGSSCSLNLDNISAHALSNSVGVSGWLMVELNTSFSSLCSSYSSLSLVCTLFTTCHLHSLCTIPGNISGIATFIDGSSSEFLPENI